jgi:glutamyl-tRNA synthetase
MVRVRFAPSPTGPLHIGGVRTALYNYLFARKHGGQMLLRIEDTDQNRYVEGAEEYILKALEWCGIKIDEGQGVGGPHAPYRQSERKEIYRQYAESLVAAGKAYYAFDTTDQIEAMRARLEAAGADAAQYNALTRLQMTNSLTISDHELKRRLDAGEPAVIRIKIDPKDEVRFNDLIRGWVAVHASTLDDKVLLKSDGMPTYHLANIVDDHLMNITHVIRGEEWLPSAPLHVLLYQYFGWDTPTFAHLPLLLKPEGNGKLSKRDGELGGFPIFPLKYNNARGFKEDGYLPDATVNFLAFLGWNPGIEQEIFSMNELIEAFSMARIHKAGARFDIQKAQWFNQQYIKQLSDQQLATMLTNDPPMVPFVMPDYDTLIKICGLMRDRVTFVHEILSDSSFLFETPKTYEEAVVSAKWNQDAVKATNAYIEDLEVYEGEFLADAAKAIFATATERIGIKTGKVTQALRLAVTGQGHGPDLMLSIEILGKNEVIARLKKAVQEL